MFYKPAEGKEKREIAKELGVTQDTVGKWRTRFFHKEEEGLEDKRRRGEPQKFDHGMNPKFIEIPYRKPKGMTPLVDLGIREKGESGACYRYQPTVQRIVSAADLKPH